MVHEPPSSSKVELPRLMGSVGRRARRFPTRSLHIVGVATVVMVSGTYALAEASHAKPHRSQPATMARASSETTGTVSTTPAKTALGKVGPSSSMAARLASLPDPAAPDIDPLPTPFELPVASRARMRLCGERWHRMKLDGEAHDEIWREFATSCLVAKDAEDHASRSREADIKPGLVTNKSR